MKRLLLMASFFCLFANYGMAPAPKKPRVQVGGVEAVAPWQAVNFLQQSVNAVGSVTPEAFNAFAYVNGFLSREELAVLVDALRYIDHPYHLLITQAIATHNAFALVNAVEAGMKFDDIADLQDFVSILNSRMQCVWRFIEPLSGAQRARLMDAAARAGACVVVAALLGVGIALPAGFHCDTSLTCQLYALPFMARVRATMMLSEEERKRFASIAVRKKLTSDSGQEQCARALVRPELAICTSGLVDFIAQRLPVYDMGAVVARICTVRRGGWLAQAIVKADTRLIERFIQNGASLSDREVNQTLVNALFRLNKNEEHHGLLMVRIMHTLTSAQRRHIGDLIRPALRACASGDGEQTCYQEFSLGLCLLAVEPLDLPLPQVTSRMVAILGGMLKANPVILAYAFAHLSSAQRTSLQEQLMVYARDVGSSRRRDGLSSSEMAAILARFITVAAAPTTCVLGGDEMTMLLLNYLPHPLLKCVLSHCPDDVLECLAHHAEVEANRELASLVRSRGVLCKALACLPLDEVVCRHSAGKAKGSVADCPVDLDLILRIERYAFCAGRGVSALAILRAFSDAQRKQVADVAVLLNLQGTVNAVSAVGVDVPSPDTVHIDDSLAIALERSSALLQWENGCQLRPQHQYELRDCAMRYHLENMILALLVAQVPCPDYVVSPRMVLQIAQCNLFLRQRAIWAMNLEQRRQVARVGGVLGLAAYEGVKLGSDFVAEEQETVDAKTLVYALDELDVAHALFALKKMSLEYKRALYPQALQCGAWHLCAGLLLDGAVDTTDCPINVMVVNQLSEQDAMPGIACLIDRLTLEQREQMMFYASVLHADYLIKLLHERAGLAPIDLATIVIDQDLACELERLPEAVVRVLVGRLTTAQQEQLFVHADNGGFGGLMVHLMASAPDRFSSSPLPVLHLECFANDFSIAKIITSLAPEKRQQLAALTRVADLATIKKHLLIQGIPLPDCAAIVIDESFVRALDAVCPSAVAIDQLSDDQLTRLYQLAREHHCTHILILFDPAIASPRMQAVAMRVHGPSAHVFAATDLLDDAALRCPWRSAARGGDGMI